MITIVQEHNNCYMKMEQENCKMVCKLIVILIRLVAFVLDMISRLIVLFLKKMVLLTLSRMKLNSTQFVKVGRRAMSLNLFKLNCLTHSVVLPLNHVLIGLVMLLLARTNSNIITLVYVMIISLKSDKTAELDHLL